MEVITEEISFNNTSKLDYFPAKVKSDPRSKSCTDNVDLICIFMTKTKKWAVSANQNLGFFSRLAEELRVHECDEEEEVKKWREKCWRSESYKPGGWNNYTVNRSCHTRKHVDNCLYLHIIVI